MIPRPPRSTSTATLVPDTTLFRTCLENIGFEPGAQNLTRNRIDALFCQDALFYLEDRDRRNVELVGIRAVRPCGDFGREPIRSAQRGNRSEEHTSELQALMRLSYAVFCLEKNNNHGLMLPDLQT